MRAGETKNREQYKERNDEIVDLWNAGHHASAIAWRLGVSRSTVLGVVDRRGIMRRQDPLDKRPAIGGGGDALERVPRRGCVYPIGEPGEEGFKFCGAPVAAERPYCAEHCTLCYRPIDPAIVLRRIPA